MTERGRRMMTEYNRMLSTSHVCNHESFDTDHSFYNFFIILPFQSVSYLEHLVVQMRRHTHTHQRHLQFGWKGTACGPYFLRPPMAETTPAFVVPEIPEPSAECASWNAKSSKIFVGSIFGENRGSDGGQRGKLRF